MKNLAALLILSFVIFSCSTQKPEDEKPLMDQVMEIHDEVMPLMGDIMKTKKQLIEKGIILELTDTVAAQNLFKLAERLDLSNEAMMDWMHNFDPTFEGSEVEVQEYLLKKKEGIQKVAEAMNGSLEAGKKALQ